MDTAKVFRSGNSQAVRLPKAYRFATDRVRITRMGKGLLLEPVESGEDPWEEMLAAAGRFSEDFFAQGREQPPMPDDDIAL